MTSTWWRDEVRNFFLALNGEEPEQYFTKVKYTFNRPLTWSEREDLKEWLRLDDSYVDHLVERDNPSVVTLTYSDDMDSRDLTAIISDWAETTLNLHPISAHTITPKVRV